MLGELFLAMFWDIVLAMDNLLPGGRKTSFARVQENGSQAEEFKRTES